MKGREGRGGEGNSILNSQGLGRRDPVAWAARRCGLPEVVAGGRVKRGGTRRLVLVSASSAPRLPRPRTETPNSTPRATTEMAR